MVHQTSFFQCPQIIPVICTNTARAFHFPNFICHLFFSIFAKHLNSLIWSTNPLSQSNLQFNNYFKSPWILQQNNYIIIHNHYISSWHLEKHDWQIKIQYFVTITFNACYAYRKVYLTNWLLWLWWDYLKKRNSNNRNIHNIRWSIQPLQSSMSV
jgi:hypothetical protein